MRRLCCDVLLKDHRNVVQTVTKLLVELVKHNPDLAESSWQYTTASIIPIMMMMGSGLVFVIIVNVVFITIVSLMLQLVFALQMLVYCDKMTTKFERSPGVILGYGVVFDFLDGAISWELCKITINH